MLCIVFLKTILPGFFAFTTLLDSILTITESLPRLLRHAIDVLDFFHFYVGFSCLQKYL